MLSVQVNIRAVSPQGLGQPLYDDCCATEFGSGAQAHMERLRTGVRRDGRRVPGDAQRVPSAANLATSAMFCLVTKAGPVSTGAAPPPLKLPLDLYSQIESTAR